jgi:sterol desaturase/sphingolipid hydroxylase (fatty acid hydroxylase superfamily)
MIMALVEHLRPKRKLEIKKAIRWTRNLSIIAIDSVAVRILIPFTAASVAIYAEQSQIGLLHYLPIPFTVSVIISVILLDLLIYAQHVAFHYTPLLWRLHQVHHIDQEIDVTTGVRFHPVEIILSTLIKCVAVLLLGIPFFAVLVFEILLNATAMFNHGNLSLPVKADKWLRMVVVTPDMHRVHHSVIIKETNSNFGFNLPWWDRLFKTYQAQPGLGHIKMEIGLEEYKDARKTGLIAMLAIPFMTRRKELKNE